MKKYILLLAVLLACAFNMRAQCLFFTTCNDSETICDFTPNNDELWNDANWWDPFNQSHDLSEAPCDLFAVAVDTCSVVNFSARYTLFLDIDRDGLFETVVKSWDPPAPGTVNFNNINNPNYDGGEPRVFDQRAVPNDQKYQFALETIATGDTLSARMRWNTQAAPNTFIIPEMPYSYTNKIEWEFADNLSNVQQCTDLFVVKDCLAPTIGCINEITVSISQGGYVTLWATDFLQQAEDNSTTVSNLKYGIRKLGDGSGFPVDSQGNPVTSIAFTCEEVGDQGIELWAIDLDGNADYCTTNVSVQDNFGFCAGAVSGLSVCIRRWCDDAVVTGVDLSILGSWNPPFNFSGLNSSNMDNQGCWNSDSLLPSIPVLSNISIVPVKEDDPLNGVTPLDLVKISRHILGLEPLSAYAMIAADANRSNSITTFDIVEQRKLIQGIYQELPSISSWRFIDADHVFLNPANPFQLMFPESNSINGFLLDTVYEKTFVAIKIGDVDCDATPGATAAPDDRQVRYLSMPDALLAAGETLEIPLSFTEAGNWTAMQLGLQYDPELLEIESIVPGNLPDMEENSFASPDPGILNLVWFTAQASRVPAHESLCTLRLRAKQALQLSQTLSLTRRKPETPRRLRAEGYDAQETPFRFELLFRDGQMPEGGNQSTIYQPQPNPTASQTSIPIQLYQDAAVRIAVTDVAGKILWQQETMLGAGLQMLDVPATALPKPGVYFWRVEACGTLAGGKIIRR